jgi:hypothetical protein
MDAVAIKPPGYDNDLKWEKLGAQVSILDLKCCHWIRTYVHLPPYCSPSLFL